MADAAAKDGAAKPNGEATGGEEISALFSTEAAKDAPPPSETESTAPSEDFVKRFHDAEGKIDGAKAVQSLWDTKRAHTTATQRLAELEKAAKAEVPAEAGGYIDDDWRTAFKSVAPKGYAGTEDEEKALLALFEAAREGGVPVEQARSMVQKLYAAREEGLPDRDDRPEAEKAADRRRKAQAGFPNGKIMASDVEAWLMSRHKAQPFPEAELARIGELVESADGLSLLWRLSRQGTAAPADLTHAASPPAMDLAKERAEVERLLGTQDQAEWNKIRDETLARYERLKKAEAASGVNVSRPWVSQPPV